MVRYAYGAWLVLAPCSLDVVEPGARSQASPALRSPSALAVALPSGLRCEGSDKKPPRARHIASNDTSRVRAIPITLVPTFMEWLASASRYYLVRSFPSRSAHTRKR